MSMRPALLAQHSLIRSDVVHTISLIGQTDRYVMRRRRRRNSVKATHPLTYHEQRSYTSAISRRRLIVDRVAAAAGVDTTYAPPATCCYQNNTRLLDRGAERTVFLHDLQSQMPVEWRFTVVLPQKVHGYLLYLSRLLLFLLSGFCLSLLLRVLLNYDLLALLTERGTETCTVLSGDSDLLRALRHCIGG